MRGWKLSFFRNSLSDAQFSCDTAFHPAFNRAFARATLKLENLSLRHQIAVLQRSAGKRAKLTPLDRLLWATDRDFREAQNVDLIRPDGDTMLDTHGSAKPKTCPPTVSHLQCAERLQEQDMADPEHLAVLRNALKHTWIYDTAQEWNRWILPRLKVGQQLDEFVLHPPVDLSGADLHGCNLSHLYLDGVDFEGADLRDAQFHMSKLRCVNLQGAHMERSWLNRAVFSKANLRGAHLEEARVMATDLADADLRDAHLQGANLSRAVLLKTKLQGANLTGANIYGVSVWDIEFDQRTVQFNLIITHHDAAPVVTVDNIEVAQFIYLLMENEGLQKVIDTITSKVVLILGRFADPYKQVLDAIRQELRKRDFTPVIFDFEKPSTRSVTSTMTTLAHMARFVIADITDPQSVPQELTEVTHALPRIPIQPILQADAKEWSMFPDLKDRGVVLRTLRYTNVGDLRKNLIDAALANVDAVLRATGKEAGVAAMAEKLAALNMQLEAKEKRLAELEERIRSASSKKTRRA